MVSQPVAHVTVWRWRQNSPVDFRHGSSDRGPYTMTMRVSGVHVLTIILVCVQLTNGLTKPNIIVVVADDLGWDDVGFHGSDQIPTPNVDKLAHEGIILNNYYVQQLCTPTRAALLTGRYPIHTGLQHGVILGSAPYGLGLEEKILPQYLKESGYKTHMVGKWHLGFFAKEYTPTYRGFDSHYGYWLGAGDYWDHTSMGVTRFVWGLDFRRNMDVDRTGFGQYSTELFTNESVHIIQQHDKTKPLFLYLAQQAVHSATNINRPLEAPYEYVQRVQHIKDPDRRTFAAMTVAMDDSIGRVYQALKEEGMLNNTIIVFTSDNGGPTNHFNKNVASNWPLRGMKNTLWEGGVRVPAFIWSPLLKSKARVSHQLMHVTDWLPTLMNAIGAPVSNTSRLDGVNQWPALSQNQSSARTEILINTDSTWKVYSLRMKEFKLIYPFWRNKNNFGWYKPENSQTLKFAPFERDSLYDEEYDHLEAPNIDEERYNNMDEEQINNVLDRANTKYPSGNMDNPVVDCGPKPPDAATNCRSGDVCLYHIPSDPCEYRNIYKQEPELVRVMQARLSKYNEGAVKPKNKRQDPRGFPYFNNGVWEPWVDLGSQ